MTAILIILGVYVITLLFISKQVRSEIKQIKEQKTETFRTPDAVIDAAMSGTDMDASDYGYSTTR